VRHVLRRQSQPIVRSRVELLKQDHLLQNSFYLMLSTATMGLLGFLFWLLNARLFSPSQIGLATTLISATSLISYLSLFGFNTTFIRFLPTSPDRDAEISTGLTFVFGGALLVSAAYIFGVPAFVPGLRFVSANPWFAIGFVLLTACAAVNLVTDSVFVAFRAAKYNFLIDGVIQGGTKLALPIVLVGLGAYGIFAASGIAAFAAVAVSLVFMMRILAYKPRLQIHRAVVRMVWGYSAANYLANLLNIVPILILPLIVIRSRGAADAGFYYVAFQIANLLNAVSYAVSESLLAEGSYEEESIPALAKRSARFQAVTMVPATAALILCTPLLLSMFGHDYRAHSATTLEVLLLAAPAVAFNTWTSALLRLTRQLAALIWSNVAFVVVLCGLAALWVDRGLPWVAGAWLLGNLLSGAIGAIALVTRRSWRPTDRQPDRAAA